MKNLNINLLHNKMLFIRFLLFSNHPTLKLESQKIKLKFSKTLGLCYIFKIKLGFE